MSLVDAEYWFIWASVGALVNTHYSILLQSTDLWKIIVRGGMIPNVVQEVEDIEIPPLILGEGAFPLWTFFFFYPGFLSQTFINHRTARKGEDISLTPHYHFHPLHRHLDISQVITAQNSPLRIASSRTRTGNIWFRSASR